MLGAWTQTMSLKSRNVNASDSPWSRVRVSTESVSESRGLAVWRSEELEEIHSRLSHQDVRRGGGARVARLVEARSGGGGCECGGSANSENAWLGGIRGSRSDHHQVDARSQLTWAILANLR